MCKLSLTNLLQFALVLCRYARISFVCGLSLERMCNLVNKFFPSKKYFNNINFNNACTFITEAFTFILQTLDTRSSAYQRM